MKIRDEHVEKFKKLYEKTFKEKITQQEAFEQCFKLVDLVSETYRPSTLKNQNNMVLCK
jgi:hypothetical protein